MRKVGGRLVLLAMMLTWLGMGCDEGDEKKPETPDVVADTGSEDELTFTVVDDPGGTSYDIGMSPRLFVDPQGHVHVSYTTTHGGGVAKLHVKYATNESGEWVTELVAPGGATDHASGLVVTNDGAVSIGYIGDFQTVAFAARVNGEWSVTQLLDTLCGHVGFASTENATLEQHIFFRKDSGNGGRLGHFVGGGDAPWKEDSIDDESIGAESPSAVGHTNHEVLTDAHVAHILSVWPDPPKLQYSLFTSKDRKSTVVVDEELDEVSPTDIHRDANGHLHIVVRDRYYESDTGTTWTRDELPVLTGAPAVTADEVGALYVCGTNLSGLWFMYWSPLTHAWTSELLHEGTAKGDEFGANCDIALSREPESKDVHILFHADKKLYHVRFPRDILN